MCEDCGAAFNESSGLIRHKKFVHRNVRDNMCDECGKTFGLIANLRKHIDSVHLNIKKYVCQECGVDYTQAHNLKKHMRLIHSEGRVTVGKRGPGRPPRVGSTFRPKSEGDFSNS